MTTPTIILTAMVAACLACSGFAVGVAAGRRGPTGASLRGLGGLRLLRGTFRRWPLGVLSTWFVFVPLAAVLIQPVLRIGGLLPPTEQQSVTVHVPAGAAERAFMPGVFALAEDHFIAPDLRLREVPLSIWESTDPGVQAWVGNLADVGGQHVVACRAPIWIAQALPGTTATADVACGDLRTDIESQHLGEVFMPVYSSVADAILAAGGAARPSWIGLAGRTIASYAMWLVGVFCLVRLLLALQRRVGDRLRHLVPSWASPSR